MDIGSAFAYMFQDEDWIKKLLIGTAIFLVATLLSGTVIGLVLFFPLTGYMLAIIRSVRDGHDLPLPEWDDFGDLFIKGAVAMVITVIYNMFTILIAFPIIVISIIIPVFGHVIDPALGEILAYTMLCLGCLLPLVALVGIFFTPIAMIRYALYETFGAAFDFGAIFEFIKNNISNYIIVIIVLLLASAIASFIGSILICVGGIFFTSFWLYLVTGHLYGQLARHEVGSEQGKSTPYFPLPSPQ